jgi:site-specific DNA recombinase
MISVATPAAYLRKSSSRDPAREISRELQEASVRRMASAFGDNGENLKLFVDWGISGAKVNRPEYVALKAAISSGSVSSLYAYSLSRLGRNARELLDLFELCAAHNVKVMCEAEGLVGGGSAMGKFVNLILAGIAELERDQAAERSASARAARAARGDAMGHARYGQIHVKVGGVITVAPDPSKSAQPVVDAFREAGSVLGACRLLNRDGVPGPRGGKWLASTVARVIDYAAPEMLPRKTLGGRRVPSHDALSQLVACPFCSTRLTPNRSRKLYYCYRGAADRTSHPRICANETKLMAFAAQEAGRLIVPDLTILADSLEGRRTALEEKRVRWIESYAERLCDKATRDRRIASIDRELTDLEAEAGAVELPTNIDWTAGIAHPRELNGLLRTMWDRIELNPDMSPKAVVWRRPEWRRS